MRAGPGVFRPGGRIQSPTAVAIYRHSNQDDDPLNRTAITSYDPAGNFTLTDDFKGYQTTYAYDAADRLTSVTDPLNQTTTTTYDAAGNATVVTPALNRNRTVTEPEDGAQSTIRLRK
jgi:YD repeat-containing protein